MTERELFRPLRTNPNAFVPRVSTAPAQTGSEVSAAQGGKRSLDELLLAFSEVAYAPDEEDVAWESWNYSRLSTF